MSIWRQLQNSLMPSRYIELLELPTKSIIVYLVCMPLLLEMAYVSLLNIFQGSKGIAMSLQLLWSQFINNMITMALITTIFGTVGFILSKLSLNESFYVAAYVAVLGLILGELDFFLYVAGFHFTKIGAMITISVVIFVYFFIILRQFKK
jgi:hypothetical protein